RDEPSERHELCVSVRSICEGPKKLDPKVAAIGSPRIRWKEVGRCLVLAPHPCPPQWGHKPPPKRFASRPADVIRNVVFGAYGVDHPFVVYEVMGERLCPGIETQRTLGGGSAIECSAVRWAVRSNVGKVGAARMYDNPVCLLCP